MPYDVTPQPVQNEEENANGENVVVENQQQQDNILMENDGNNLLAGDGNNLVANHNANLVVNNDHNLMANHGNDEVAGEQNNRDLVERNEVNVGLDDMSGFPGWALRRHRNVGRLTYMKCAVCMQFFSSDDGNCCVCLSCLKKFQ